MLWLNNRRGARPKTGTFEQNLDKLNQEEVLDVPQTLRADCNTAETIREPIPEAHGSNTGVTLFGYSTWDTNLTSSACANLLRVVNTVKNVEAALAKKLSRRLQGGILVRLTGSTQLAVLPRVLVNIGA